MGKHFDPASKYLGVSKLYKYVYCYATFKDGKQKGQSWSVKLDKGTVRHYSTHSTEREAGMKVDLVLIANNMEPINILKRKPKQT